MLAESSFVPETTSATTPGVDDQEPFTLLLPVYAGDRSDFLRRAFGSATVDQHLAPDAVVLVQDGPVGDELGATIADLAAGSAIPVQVLRLAHNVGLARALEEGLAVCGTEIVARADADDISLPHRFAVQLPLVRGGLDLVGSAITEFIDEERPGLVRVPPLTSEAIARYARFHDPFNHPSVVYRRSAVRAAGGYRELERMEDYWLFARMIAAGARTANIADSLVLYRVGAGAYGRRGGRQMLRTEIALQRHLRAIGFTSPAQRVRNLVLRGGYRLVPEALRRLTYRAMRRQDPGAPAAG